MITGSLAPSAGEIRGLGEALAAFGRRTRERIGYMPQSFILYPALTDRENVDFVARLFGVLLLRRGRRTRQVLELLDLWSARGRRAVKLSGECSVAWSSPARWSTSPTSSSSTSRPRASIRSSAGRSGTSSIACATGASRPS
jgi:hypothetical protein